jgi:hypothetical protein
LVPSQQMNCLLLTPTNHTCKATHLDKQMGEGEQQPKWRIAKKQVPRADSGTIL